MRYGILALIIVSAVELSAEPIGFLEGVYDSSGKTSWGQFTNITIDYQEPTDLLYTFSEIRGQAYVYNPVTLRIYNDDEVLFIGTFGIGGLSLWVPNDAVTPFYYGVIEGTISARFAEVLGFGDGVAAYNAAGMFRGADLRYYSSDGWAYGPGEWGMYIGPGQADAPVPEPALFIPTAASVLLLIVRRGSLHEDTPRRVGDVNCQSRRVDA